jgi:addiction module HigA family antidote
MWEDIAMTQQEFADVLGVSRQTVAELLGSRRNVTADMAHRLARALKGSPNLWMNMQQNYDLWASEQANRREYAKIRAVS